MNLNSRINALHLLGNFMAQFSIEATENDLLAKLNLGYYDRMTMAIQQAKIQNGWFTEDHIRLSLSSWGKSLTEENLTIWANQYTLSVENPKAVGIIMAGNIPLVGFHDLISVLLSGHKALVKLSSDDRVLIPLLLEVLVEIEPEFSSYFQLISRLENHEAVIATGSNNSARYFELYFGKYPNIIRKNRTSIAVIDGTESDTDLAGLANDIMLYFGLGCRNVSKVYLPKDYDLDNLFKALYPFKEYGNHNKFANNYDYNKAIYLLNSEPLLENGFLLMREAKELNSPVGVLLYERYDDLASVQKIIADNLNNLQCVVAKSTVHKAAVPFGKAQQPELWDYADGVDTLSFLANL